MSLGATWLLVHAVVWGRGEDPQRCLTPPPSTALYCIAAGAERELHLEFEATKGQSPVISRGGITVGRAPGCDLRVDAPSASDRHARLHQCGELPSAACCVSEVGLAWGWSAPVR